MQRSVLASLVVAGVCFLSLVLRWPIASHDVQHYVGPDEGEVVENVLEMLKTGDFDQRHPGYPGLHFYIQMIPAELVLRWEGKTVSELPREGFYLWARRTTLLAGVLVALVTYLIGLHWLSPWTSALAASLVAMSPLGFRESAVVNPDLMMSLFVGASVLLSLRALEMGSRVRFLMAGASVGLATAIKYTGAFVILPYLLASAFGPRPRFRRALGGLAAAAVAFVLTSPYTLLKFPEFVRGLDMHVGYYRASNMNAALELLRVLAIRGVGLLAFGAAVAAAALVLRSREPRRLVVLGYPVLYLLVFAFFDRAFPRHALPLLSSFALFAADLLSSASLAGALKKPRVGALALGLAMLGQPLWGSFELARRLGRSTPAERAASWTSSHIPPGSRILEDQYTPRIDPHRYRVKRLEVEEKIFLGDFDWVLYSGYPPGIETSGLREVARFPPEGALGDTVFVYQVPDRESLMPTTLLDERQRAAIEAGELPFFGEGFDPPEGGAYGTERLTRGETAEIYVVLPKTFSPAALDLSLELASAVAGFETDVTLSWNGAAIGTIRVEGEEPRTISVEVPRELPRGGLNRLTLRFASTARVDRRHREAAIRFYSLTLTRS